MNDRVWVCETLLGSRYTINTTTGWITHRDSAGTERHLPAKNHPQLNPENPGFSGRVLVGHEGKA